MNHASIFTGIGGFDIAAECIGWKNVFNRQTTRWTLCEPDVVGVVHGIPDEVDRIKGLGNAIVPQVAFEIFKAIEQVSLSI